MWFVFPQLRSLGTSWMADQYGLESIAEAAAYGMHPILGARLRECVDLVLAVQRRSASRIFGWPDDMKFQSCLTLFELADPSSTSYAGALDKYYAGERDTRTLQLLEP